MHGCLTSSPRAGAGWLCRRHAGQPCCHQREMGAARAVRRARAADGFVPAGTGRATVAALPRARPLTLLQLPRRASLCTGSPQTCSHFFRRSVRATRRGSGLQRRADTTRCILCAQRSRCKRCARQSAFPTRGTLQRSSPACRLASGRQQFCCTTSRRTAKTASAECNKTFQDTTVKLQRARIASTQLGFFVLVPPSRCAL